FKIVSRLVIQLVKIKENKPKWLEGVLYYTGPGIFKIHQRNYFFDHWFDGL
ncbi:4529_t:CDS:1, partial [Gigaspora margarita]